MNYNLQIPCASGIEASVKRQLSKLGYGDCKADNGRILLSGTDYDIARLNVFLSSAERVLIVVGTFTAVTFDQLYEQIRAIPWQDYCTCRANVLTYAKSVNSTLFALKSICSVSKKAILDKLTDHYHANFDQQGERIMVEIAFCGDVATVTIDASGQGLHIRGYRTLAYTAPLKETTAAALLDLSYYFPDKTFADLFCGSGTLPIEAALRSCNMAPGINRDFDFTSFCFMANCLAKVREEAQDAVKIRPDMGKIFAKDISPEAISIARYHATRAGVDKFIHFEVADYSAFSCKTPYGVMISNIPYGERIGDTAEVDAIKCGLGTLLRRLPKWNVYILTTAQDLERKMGRTADKKRKIYNANLECSYYSFLSPKPPTT